jgi:glucans biosynthesis protein
VQRPLIPVDATLRAAVAAATLLAAGVASAFGFDDLAARAQALSQQPPRPPLQAPAELRALSYDQARDIRFRPDRALWRDLGLPFEAMFFHLGYVQTQAVRLHELLPDGTVRPLAYDPAAFDTGRTRIDPAVARDLGYAGFRIHHALNSPAYKDELVVLQGAS